jgi:hypothetical protein
MPTAPIAMPGWPAINPRPSRTSALAPTARGPPGDPPRSHRRQLRGPLLELD